MFNKKLLSEEVQSFIEKNINTDINKLILKGSPIDGISAKELATQIQTKKSAQKKLPTWYNTKGIVFPPKLNLEQSSSETTAAYKSELILDGELVDLTGGFGVDDYYFSKKAKHVVHCEINEELSLIVKHNAQILGVENISFYSGDSSSYLSSIKNTSTIYIDPSRRANSGRVFLLEDCEPNVIEKLDFYLKKAKKIIIKAAPMLDIDAAVNLLKNVTEIHIVSLNNECKELLIVIEHQKPVDIVLKCVLINSNSTNTYSFNYKEEKNIEIKYGAVSNYLYEPDAALLKAGLFKSVANKFRLNKLNPNSHIYTSMEVIENFPGRTLKVKELFDYKQFEEKNKIKQGNVITRNFHLNPEAIKKKCKIKDGGENYLYFTTDKNEKKIVIVCERL
jgi:precorrin-6B methylase 2